MQIIFLHTCLDVKKVLKKKILLKRNTQMDRRIYLFCGVKS